MTRKKTPAVAKTVPVVDVLTTYPVETTREELYKEAIAASYADSLLPQNLLPADQTLSAVAAHNALPIAVLVLDSGEVMPPPIPYTANVLTKPLHTKEEVALHRAAYEEAEEARVQSRLAKNVPIEEDPIEAVAHEEEVEDLYGQSMSSAVVDAFPGLKD